MKSAHALAVLTLVNLGMLIFVLSHHAAPVQASGAEQVVRARALEIVDAQGKVRASISVIPEGPGRRADGSPTEHGNQIFPEAVVLRLIRPDGRPSVKIATTEQGSGIDLSGGNRSHLRGAKLRGRRDLAYPNQQRRPSPSHQTVG